MQPWTEEDIRKAIQSWKGNKSPGPNGYTGEFYNTFLDILLPDLKEVFTMLNQLPQLTLHPLNDSYIVLIPKKEAANQPQEFRPISLVNGIQKIYSKVLASKIKPLLHRLLSPNQTGFLNSRSILHGFHYAQQVIQSAAKQKVQIAALKADIHKAFDTLDWKFLSRSLQARGFPQTMIDHIRNKILKGSSRIILNAVAGRTINLKRGVRQGDPISPYLFNISMDFLIRWTQKLTDQGFLSSPFPNCRPCLLYADDTLLLLKPTRNQLLKIGLLLHIFGQLSGLKVNLTKSELAVTAADPSITQNLSAILCCKPTSFPIKYLGLPLSNKRLTKNVYMPLVNRIQMKLTGWKASLLSVGGRLVLLNSVLTAMPQYFMSVFMLPKWVLRTIDRIRRFFLWHGHKDQQNQGRRLFMVNWSLVTRPKKLGGLGVRDLHISNQALLAKWMWQWHNSNNNWWKEATPTSSCSARPWDNPQQSNFWKTIACISSAFNSSVAYKIGNGQSVKFWSDNWHGTPLKTLFPNLYQASQQKNYSVSQYRTATGWDIRIPLLNTVAQAERQALMTILHHLHTTPTKDEIIWIRKDSTFTVKAFYDFLSHTPSPTFSLANIWSIKAPPRVLIFTWLMLHNRLPTIDNLTRRGWNLPNMCVMCKNSEETVVHLFQQCSLATELRNYLLDTINPHLAVPNRFATIDHMDMLTDPTETVNAKNLEITTCFVIWRERCRRTFSDQFSQPMNLIRQIRTEYNDWFTH